MQDVLFEDLGRMDYKTAWDYQESLLQKNVLIKSEARSRESGVKNLQPVMELQGDAAGSDPLTPHVSHLTPSTTNHLLFVEHPPVYTLGKSGKKENVLINEAEREAQHIAFYHTNRGGDITFHGPQQLVGYPIFDLENFYTDIGRYLRELEEVIILTMAEYGLKGERSPGETGVWLDAAVKGHERKICAMGIRCSRWITMHGFALNVNTDLRYFDNIIPCGIQNKQVTSIQKELGKDVPMEEVKEVVKDKFEKVFNVRLV